MYRFLTNDRNDKAVKVTITGSKDKPFIAGGGNKDISTAKKKYMAIAVAVILLIAVFALMPRTPAWKTYPYTIPDTDIQFPEASGLNGDPVELWSIGMFVKDDSGREYMIALLYNLWNFEQDKDYIYLDRDSGDSVAGSSKESFIMIPPLTASTDELNLSFRNVGGTYDILKESGTPFEYEFEAYIENIYLNLTFKSNAAPSTVFEGKISHNDSYYNFFALSDCTVKGTMTVEGEEKEIQGNLWFERQWGDFSWKWEWWGGWLDDGSEIEIVKLYDRGSDSPFMTYALHVDKDGEYQTVTDLQIVVNGNKTLDSGIYPAKWTISSDTLSLHMTLEAKRLIDFGGFSIAEVTGTGTLDGKDIEVLMCGMLLAEY